MNTILKKVISLVLCFVLLTGALPVGALAAEAETTAPSEILETQAPEVTEAASETTEAAETEPSVPETTAASEATEAPEETEAETEATEAAEEEETTVFSLGSIGAEAVTGDSVPLAAAIFGSDIHEESTSLTGSGTSALKSVLSAIGDNGVTYDTMGFVGDTYTDIAGKEADMTSAAQTALGQNAGVYYAWGDHDAKSDISSESGLLYTGDYYYIYHLSDMNMRSKAGATDSNVESAISAFETSAASMDKSKVLFIMTHAPLHDRRDDNTYANDWYTAIKEVADTMEVVVFWAHNHTGEDAVDRAAYYVARDGSETMTIYGGSTVIPNFTYMNAGYIYAAGQNPSRKGVATTVEIYADELVFQDYNSSGTYTDASYSHNVTVAREFTATAVTLSSIAISGTTEYYVGDELDLTVTATYSDGSTENVTADATLSGYDMSTAGTYTVKAEYEGMTAEYSITVSAPYITSVALTAAPTKLTYTVGEELDTTGMVVTATYSNGTTADVTAKAILSGYDMDTLGTQTVKVSVYDNGTNFNNMSFTITVEKDMSDLILEKIEITTPPTKTEYLLSQELDLDGMVVVATFSDGSTVELAYKPFSTSTVYGGYDLYNFSMYVEKAHELAVVYTFGDVTCYDTTTINVWNEDFTDENTGVKVHVAEGDYGVTAVAVVEPSTNAYVASAIGDYIDGDYVAYDITLALDTKAGSDTEYYALTDGIKTVTLPIPEGVTNPVVCYVSDDGTTVTNMYAVVSGSNVVFETTHFSTYVVGEDVTIETESGNATVEGSTSTTTKDVYVKVDAPVDGEEYLIVSTGTAGTSGYVMGNTTAVTPASGTLTVNGTEGTYTYIETTGTLWTASGSGSSWAFRNAGGTYLGYTTGSYWGQTTYTLNATDSNARTWTLSNNNLYFTTENYVTVYHYIAGGSSWSLESTYRNEPSDANVYFYQKVTASETTGTVGHVYSTEGTDIIGADALAGQTVTLSSILYDTPDGGTKTDITASSELTPTYEVVTTKGNPNVITSIDGSTATLSGVAGTAVVKVTYTYGSLVAWDEFIVTAVRREYKVTINITTTGTDADGNETTTTTPAESSVTVKQGTSLDLRDSVITYVDGNGKTYTVTGESITWTVDANATITDGVLKAGSDAANKTAVVTATWTDPYGNVLTDTLTVNIVDAVWSLNIEEQVLDENGNPTYDAEGKMITEDITAPIVIKDVTPNQTYANIWAVIRKDGENIGSLTEEDLKNLTFISSNTAVATVDKTTGQVTFVGGKGVVIITAIYEYADGKSVTDTVVFSISDEHYYIPEDGTNDFPEYPEEGAIRFDKTATAVGNFSETGITKVELSMTGVPITEDNAIDVVVMLDMTGSMTDDGMEAAEEATKAFVKTIVQNTDGSYNSNRVAVYAFNSGGQNNTAGYAIYDLVTLTAISSDDALTTANTAIDTASDKQASGGTPFNYATKQCYDTLQAAKKDGTGNDRQQFCVFMSDGGPTDYYGVSGDSHITITNDSDSGETAMAYYMTNYTSTDSSTWEMALPEEYYTNLMKADGVTVYTVGLLLQNTPSNPSPWSEMTSVSSVYNSTTDSLTTIGTHYYFTSEILKQMATDESKYIDIFTVDNADNATAKFEAIAQSILEAATDVKVTDKIADEYTMVFDFPNATVEEAIKGQEFYIEVTDYALTAVKDADGNIIDYTRGTATSLMKLYLGTNTDGSYYAATANGSTNGSNKYATPTFAKTALGTSGTKFYWTTDSTKGDSSISVEGSDGVTYYFVSDGSGEYNMISGSYASGTAPPEDIIDSDSGEKTGTNTTCNNLIIATPYFVYNASTRMLVWTAEKLSSSELALSYFLYLEKSGGYSGANSETEADTYETNDYAYLTYTNFNNRECEREFPVPQMTWNGAQVSYVFYLVNESGQPVNRAGKVVPFSEAVYVTDVFTYSIIWNKLEQSAGLEAERLAVDLVPEVYSLYDQEAVYKIHVYEDENYVNLNNHFVIESGLSNYTTYVFNTKADATKYNVPGTYVANDGDSTNNETNLTYWCKGDGIVTATVVDGKITEASYAPAAGETQVPYASLHTKTGATQIGDYAYYLDENGAVYTIVTKTNGIETYEGLDFSNTTVAFAVVWKPELVADTVVIDYGLDVVIDVTTNDALASGVVGVRADAPSGVTMGSGQYTAAKNAIVELDIGTASVESLTSVRFSLNKSNGMQFTEPAVFYYESDVNYYSDGTNLSTTSMYSQVTVIPATTVYYEEDFITLNSYTSHDKGKTWTAEETSAWTTDGTASTKVQDTDRPGVSKISELFDADNVYGYDSAYDSMSTYSMGSAAKITVNESRYGEAIFSFYGTGFDVISTTSNQSGTFVIQVAGPNNYSKNYVVDTFYGYTKNEAGEWVVSANDPNALYQVPVMKVDGLDYGKYTVTITAAFNSFFAHNEGASSYDLYLDAIRIYDPTGNQNNTANDAYKADGEGWPIYEEFRNLLIAASNYTVTENEDGTITVTGDDLSGAIFIDSSDATTSIADYVSYGPNNEVYLAANQSVSFTVPAVSTSNKIADVQVSMKSTNGSTVSVSMSANGKVLPAEISNTVTDVYYSIRSYLSESDATTITFTNTGSNVLSLTNLKITFTENPGEVEVKDLIYTTAETAAFTLMRMRAPVIEEEEVPETTVPEETEPETTVPEETEPEVTEPEEALNADLQVSIRNKSVKKGSTIVVMATTSSDVEALTVNGKEVSRYVESRFTGKRTWTTTIKAEEAGELSVEVIAFSAEGEELETATETITVTSKSASVVQQIIGSIIGALFR